jgi:hypothetical protein
MKMLTINTGIIKIASAALLSILFGFSIQAQAATAKPTTNSTTFDHTQTGFILKDVHLTLKCEQCHVDGIFKNTPTYCAGCHAVGTRVAATPMPLNHVQTTQPCDTCHISAASFQVRVFNHMGVTGNCTSCHGGQTLGVVSLSSTRVSSPHIPLTAYPTLPDCVSCHTNTSTFLSYYSANLHTGIVGGCSQCHGGPPGADAGSGTIGTFPGVVSYNAATHVPLTSQVNCNSCHFTFSTFLGATYTHTSLDSSKCTSCHMGQYAGVVSYVAGVHIPLPAGSSCTSCHTDPSIAPGSKPTFLGSVFHTSTFGNTTSAATSAGGSCKACHGGSYTSQNAQPVGATHIPTTADCSSCHTDATGTPVNNTANFTTFLNAKFHLTSLGNPPTGLCATCHNGSYITEGAQSTTSITATHIPYTGDCAGCHTAANTATYTSFLGSIFHQTSAGNTAAAADAAGSGKCVTCHNGSYVVQNAQPVGSTHIPFTADCSVCHTDSTGTSVPANNTGNFTSFQGSVFHTTTAGNTVAAADAAGSGQCVTCHNGSYLSEGLGAASLTSVTGSHIPVLSSTDCGTCHTASNTSAFSTFLNSVFHTTSQGNTSVAADAAGSGKCITCHNGSYLAQNAQAEGATHIPTGADCSVCHTDASGTPANNTSGFTTFSGSYFHKTTAGNPPTGLCSTCHNGSYLTEGVGGIGAQSTSSVISNHVALNGSDCAVCHTAANTASYTTFLGAIYSHVPSPYTTFPQSTGQSPTCTSCHNGSVLGALSKPSGHVSTTLDCNNSGCHTPTTDGCGATGTCTTFSGVVYSHATAYSSFPQTTAVPSPTCTSCHNGTTNLAQTINTGHVPIGTLECNYCHTPADTGCGTTGACSSFLNAKYNHTGALAASCSTCHLGQTYANVVQFNSAIHIPSASYTTANSSCVDCHTSAIAGLASFPSTSGSFLGVTFHASGATIVGLCSTCHSGTYLTTQAIPASTTSSIITSHVPIGSTDCVTCHTSTNTSNYTTFLNGTFVHTSGNTTTGQCGTCHLSQYANVVSLNTAIHIPIVSTIAANACDSCHPSPIGVTTPTFTGVVFHSTTYGGVGGTAVAQTCTTCHSGTYMTTQTTPAYSETGQNGSHIPTPTSVDCVVCHVYSTTSTYTSFVATAKTVMVHNATTAPAGGCGTCHLGQYSGVVSLTSVTHIPQSSGNACDACHTSAISAYTTASPTFANVLFHTNALGNPPTGTCSTCHSGTYTPGPSTAGTNTGLAATGAQGENSVSGFTHMTTTADCVTCHTASNTSSYTTFLGAGYSHTATYPAWTSATTGFPTTPSPTCASCHNGTTATGVNTGHPAIGTSDCVACHTSSILQGCPSCTLFGVPAAVVHNTTAYTAATGGCVSCHNGTTAVGLSSDTGHIPTTGTSGCQQCHPVYDGTTSINFSTAATTTLTPLPTSGVAKYTMNHTGVGTVCGTSCHNGSYTSQGLYGAMAQTSISNHIPTTIYSTADCTGCHTTFTANTNFAITAGTTQWSNGIMGVTQHNGDVGGGTANLLCKTCHANKASGYLVPSATTSSGHNSTKTDCSMSGCHKPTGSTGTAYTSWH